uniref:Uncharacterized protein n=1 Tax=Rhizophora mucronata TaxID=61149 RepID=A0A2P2NT03_RHIMU
MANQFAFSANALNIIIGLSYLSSLFQYVFAVGHVISGPFCLVIYLQMLTSSLRIFEL